METERKLYSLARACAALDVSRSALYGLMRSGHLKFVLVGNDRRIPATEIERIAKEGAARTDVDAGAAA